MELDRRTFIGKTALSFLGMGIFNSAIGQALSSVAHLTHLETILEKLKRASELRRLAVSGGNSRAAGPLGSFQQARQIYDEIITLDPLETRAYDGKRKIFLQNKYNELQVLEMFLNSTAIFPSFTPFKARAAQEYMRIALGNKKYVNQLNNPSDLLLLSRNLFEELTVLAPDVNQYRIQLDKATLKIQQEATTLDARDNPKLKVQRRLNRTAYQSRFDNLSADQVYEKFVKMQSRRYSTDRLHHSREVYKIYINKLVKENRVREAVQNCSKLYELDTEDVNSLFLIRKICKKYNFYRELETIERINNRLKDTFWSRLSLFDVLLKKFELEGSGDTAEMSGLITFMKLDRRPFTHVIEVKTRLIKLAIAEGNFSDSHFGLLELALMIKGITSAHWIDRFNRLCVAHYKANSETEQALMVINIALQINELPLSDELLKRVHVINKRRAADNPVHNERLEYLRNQLY